MVEHIALSLLLSFVTLVAISVVAVLVFVSIHALMLSGVAFIYILIGILVFIGTAISWYTYLDWVL